MNQKNCRTPSLAKIYEAQGHLEMAVWVYRRLLEKDPRREDWKAAVERLEQKILERPCKRVEDLKPLICQWVELALCCRRVNSVRKIKTLFHAEPSAIEKP